MNADGLVALLDADAERAGKVEARATTEAILRDGDPYYFGPEASAWDREVTPETVAWLVERLRARDAAIRAVLGLCERTIAADPRRAVNPHAILADFASALGGGEQQ